MIPPHQVLEDFVHCLDGFAAFWASPDNDFLDDDGSYTVCGVMSLASWYLRENASKLSVDAWSRLGELIAAYYDDSVEMSDILGACLIENMQFEPSSAVFMSHVREDILQQFNFEGRYPLRRRRQFRS